MGAKPRQPRVPRRAGDLPPNPTNPRRITEGALEALGRSMARYGDLSGIIFNRRTGQLIGAHQRLKHFDPAAEIAIQERFDPPTATGTVAVGYVVRDDGERWSYRMVDVDATTEREMTLAANAHAGEWDEELLRTYLAQLQEAGVDLATVGFTAAEVANLLNMPAIAEIEPIARPATPDSVPGQVYQLGPHRLICADATDPATLAALFAGDARQAAVLWTDPPYGVDYVGRTAAQKTIANDQPEGLDTLLRTAFLACTPYLESDARFYIATAGGPLGLILWYGSNRESTVFEVPRPRRSGEHPTMKPPELIARQLRNSSRAGDLVLDPFAGSGSTLVAAHQLDRVARLVELDPAYCDVIRRRYADLVAPEARAVQP